MESIKDILMRRDDLSATEADDIIDDAVEDLKIRLLKDEDAGDICADHFGLEPDYLEELVSML